MSAPRRHHTLAGIAREQTIEIRVQPRAKRNAVVADAAGKLKVHVTAPPEDGRANEAAIELLAEHFGVKRRQVEIIRGATSRDKVVRIQSAGK